jgi:hypothetical protein
MRMTRQYIIMFFVFLILILGYGKKAWGDNLADKALRIAADTAEVKALLSYRQGALASCLQVKIARSCDSQWVTCRDHAWVVQYQLSLQCPVKGDGRLGMNFVIDEISGQIISHYPEIEYFENVSFCRDDADCVGGKVENQSECLNFIAAPFANFQTVSPCQCQQGHCILKKQ